MVPCCGWQTLLGWVPPPFPTGWLTLRGDRRARAKGLGVLAEGPGQGRRKRVGLGVNADSWACQQICSLLLAWLLNTSSSQQIQHSWRSTLCQPGLAEPMVTNTWSLRGQYILYAEKMGGHMTIPGVGRGLQSGVGISGWAGCGMWGLEGSSLRGEPGNSLAEI